MILVRSLGFALLIILISVVGVCAQTAEVRATSLAIGETWTTVRELRVIGLKRGVQELILRDIPRSADLSSLVLRSRRIPLRMLEWSRAGDLSGGQAGAYVLDGDDVRWYPGKTDLPQGFAGSDIVRCRVDSPADITRIGVDVVYRLKGLNWSAHYQILVHGERREEQGPVSVDLLGRVRLVNETTRSFQNARIRLIGAPEQVVAETGNQRGFLMLDRNDPLSDLWFERPSDPKAEFTYNLEETATIPACGTVEVPLVKALRTPAERLYSLVAEDFPLGMKEPEALRKWIVFRHSPDRRHGFTLPPGDVGIFLGGLRQYRLQDAWFERTTPGSEIRVDLGRAPEVTGTRSLVSRSSPIGGFLEETYAIDILNGLDFDILVEIDEKPPASLGWSLLSSTRPPRQAEHRLRFFPKIKAGSGERVEYRLRIPQPEL